MREIHEVCDRLHLRGDTPTVALHYAEIYELVHQPPTRPEQTAMIYLSANTIGDPVTTYDIADAGTDKTRRVRDAIEGMKIYFNISREAPSPDSFAEEYAYRADAQLGTSITDRLGELPVPIATDIWNPALAAGWLADHGDLPLDEVCEVTNLPFEVVAQGITEYV